MNRRTLPPQAYTREDLRQAILWLRHQPSSVKELVSDSPDSLVAYFLRAKRSGENSLEQSSPVGHQEFLTQLKSIAHEQLPQFVEAQSAPPVQEPPVAPATPVARPSSSFFQKPHQVSAPEFQSISTVNDSSIENTKFLNLDGRTRESLRFAQSRLNLSSEAEAMRVLILLGEERLKQAFPQIDS